MPSPLSRVPNAEQRAEVDTDQLAGDGYAPELNALFETGLRYL